MTHSVTCIAPGVLRWAVDIAKWEPVGGLEGGEMQFLLGLLDEDERESARKYLLLPDQKRAIVSRLMARRASNVALGIPFADVTIKRTKGRKPFCANVHRDLPPDGSLDNFNFNCSHEGDLVILASEGRACICGVDCAAPQQVRQMRRNTKSFDEFAKNFDKVFTAEEWGKVHGAGPSDHQKEDVFRRHWSCKEAFVKARGDGLGFDLGRCSFRCETFAVPDGEHLGAERAGEHFICRLLVDGALRDDWLLHSQKLYDGHYCTVARGPVKDVIDARGEFVATLRRHCFSPGEWKEFLEAPSPHFELITVADLIPKNVRELYQQAGGMSVPTGLVDAQEFYHRARRGSKSDLAKLEEFEAGEPESALAAEPESSMQNKREESLEPAVRISQIDEEFARLQSKRREIIDRGDSEQIAELNKTYPRDMARLRSEKAALVKLT